MKKRALLLILIMSMFCLTGCPGRAYSREESNAQRDKGKELMETYLVENLSGAKIEEVFADYITQNSCRYLTDFARGSFSYEGSTYDFYINIKSGQVYTSMYTKELEDKVMPYTLEKLGLSEQDMVYSIRGISYVENSAISDGKDEHFTNYPLELSGVLPVDMDNIDEDIEEILDNPRCDIDVTVMYYGEEKIGLIDMESLGLRGLTIDITKVGCQVTNNARRPLNIMEEFRYSRQNANLDPAVSYTRWDKYIFGDFVCLYQGYDYEEQEGVVEERSVEAKKDFTITYDNEIITFNNNSGVKFDRYIYTENAEMIEELRNQSYFSVLGDKEKIEEDYRVMCWRDFDGKYSLTGNGNSKITTFGKSDSQINVLYVGNAAKEVAE